MFHTDEIFEDSWSLFGRYDSGIPQKMADIVKQYSHIIIHRDKLKDIKKPTISKNQKECGVGLILAKRIFDVLKRYNQLFY